MCGKTTYTNNFIPISITPTNYIAGMNQFFTFQCLGLNSRSSDFSQQQHNIELQLNTKEVLQTQHFNIHGQIRIKLK